MNRILRKMVLSLLFILVIFSTKNVLAEKNNLNFQIGPEQSSKQLDKNRTYFDLKLNPGEKTDLRIKVQNNTDRVIHLETYAVSTTTSDTGTVVYGKSKAKSDKSLKYQMSDLAKTKNANLTLNPHEEKIVIYQVTMPTEKLDGILAGGINFVEKNNKQKSGGAVGVINQYGFSEAIVLHGQSENVLGELKLKKVNFGQISAQNTFKTELVNPNANFLNKLTIEQKIYKEGKQKPIYINKQDMLQVAPNSKFTYLTFLNGKKIAAGKYRMKLVASSKGRTWEFTKKFKVSDKQANMSNSADPTVVKDFMEWYWIMLLVLISLVIFIIWIRHRRKIRKQEELKALKLRVKQLEATKK